MKMFVLCWTIISTQFSGCGTDVMPFPEVRRFVESNNSKAHDGDYYYWMRPASPCEIKKNC